jgi:membrane fusion protein (multidrug efflux system)
MTASVEEQAPIRGLRRVSDELDRTVAAPVRQRRPLRQRLRLPLMLAGPIVVALVASYWYLTGGRYVSTDDAYIQAARTMISTDIAGRVVSVEVKDNQRVKAGQVLFKLDDRPFRIAVEETTAQLAAARLQITALRSTYQQKLADQKAAEETVTYQQREFERQRQLAATGVASRQMFDQTQMALDVARQKLVATQHDLGNILAQLGGDLESPIDEHPSVQRARAALDKAQLDLSYAVVRAPDSGIVTKVEQLQPGNYVTASIPVFSLVSDRIWVEANFKETELTHMRPGQEATIEIDTYPGHVFPAKVVSLSPGTGLTFSLLPPENATGNWVKVVQRLPVRLTLEDMPPDLPLHAGLSVTAEVDTKHQNPWMVWLDRSISRTLGPAQAGETKH